MTITLLVQQPGQTRAHPGSHCRSPGCRGQAVHPGRANGADAVAAQVPVGCSFVIQSRQHFFFFPMF